MKTTELLNGKRATTRVAPTCFVALLFFFCVDLQAQVTIGGLTDAAPGAVLDLNSGGAKGGLLLSNVTLPDLTTIPYDGTGAFPGVNSGNQETVKSQFMGAIVYHIGGNDIAAGVYVWAGKRWIPAGGAPTVKDAQGHEYSIAKFGDAGWWMTQNLRTTEKKYDDDKNLKEGASADVAEKRYNYPGTGTLADRKAVLYADDSLLLKAYGLVYSWAAASGRTEGTTDTDGLGVNPPGATHHQGICPKDWHLPSDWEWNQLEQEIATYPQKYSSSGQGAYFTGDQPDYSPLYTMGTLRPGSGTDSTYWGRQMKSTTTVPYSATVAPNSSSNSREDGGFDALLVGDVIDNGTAYSYGSVAFFWSSSSYNSSNGVSRYLTSSTTGVNRYDPSKYNLFSVRCKKD